MGVPSSVGAMFKKWNPPNPSVEALDKASMHRAINAFAKQYDFPARNFLAEMHCHSGLVECGQLKV
jgi:hypothetical protein